MPHRTWLQATTGESSAHAIARKIGRSHTSVLRWMKNGVPAEVVIEVAVRFNADVIAALIATGYMTDEQVPHLRLETALRKVPVHHLTSELHRRAEFLQRTGTLTSPDAELMRA